MDEKEKDEDFLGDDWIWNKWEEIGDDEVVPGPKEMSYYNGPHGLKDGIADSFGTILHCIFRAACMNIEIFKILSAQSNKYTRADMMRRSSRLYLGHKWKHIIVGEIICFLEQCCG